MARIRSFSCADRPGLAFATPPPGLQSLLPDGEPPRAGRDDDLDMPGEPISPDDDSAGISSLRTREQTARPAWWRFSDSLIFFCPHYRYSHRLFEDKPLACPCRAFIMPTHKPPLDRRGTAGTQDAEAAAPFDSRPAPVQTNSRQKQHSTHTHRPHNTPRLIFTFCLSFFCDAELLQRKTGACPRPRP